MTSDLRATWTGVERFVTSTREVADYLRDGLPDAGEAAALALAPVVAQQAPKRTGTLAGSVDARGATLVVGAPYAVPVNARTHYVAAAIARAEHDVVEAFDTDLRHQLQTIQG